MSIKQTIRFITYALVTSALTTGLVNAVQPMSETDMGEVSAVSGDILNVMGSPSAGGKSPDSNDPQLDSSKVDAKTRIAYTESGDSETTHNNPDLTIIPSTSNPEDSITRIQTRSQTNGELGSTSFYYDEKEHHLNSESSNPNEITINQNVKVRQVQAIQLRHSAETGTRGDVSFSNIEVNGSTSIIAR